MAGRTAFRDSVAPSRKSPSLSLPLSARVRLARHPGDRAGHAGQCDCDDKQQASKQGEIALKCGASWLRPGAALLSCAAWRHELDSSKSSRLPWQARHTNMQLQLLEPATHRLAGRLLSSLMALASSRASGAGSSLYDVTACPVRATTPPRPAAARIAGPQRARDSSA